MLDSIQIGAIVYKIELVDNLRDENGHKLFGQVLYGPQLIQLESSQAAGAMLQTLLHEILHAIRVHAGLPAPENEESLCDSFAYGLLAVFAQNPALYRQFQNVTGW